MTTTNSSSPMEWCIVLCVVVRLSNDSSFCLLSNGTGMCQDDIQSCYKWLRTFAGRENPISSMNDIFQQITFLGTQQVHIEIYFLGMIQAHDFSVNDKR